MSSTKELMEVHVRFVKKGDKFDYSEVLHCLKNPIEDFAEKLPTTSTSCDPHFNLGQHYCTDWVATEDNVFFELNPLSLPDGDSWLSREMAGDAFVQDSLEKYFEDFILVGKKVIDNEKEKHALFLRNKYNNEINLEKILNVPHPPKEDYACFLAIMKLDSWPDYDGEWDFSIDFVGVLDKETILMAGIEPKRFLSDSKLAYFEDGDKVSYNNDESLTDCI